MKKREFVWLLLKGPMEAQLLYSLPSARNVLCVAFDLIRG